MANRFKLSPLYIEALGQMFSCYTNREIAEMLTVRINEDNEHQAKLIKTAIRDGSIYPTKTILKEVSRLGRHVTISERTIQNYASKMGLKKSEQFKSQYHGHSYRKNNIIGLIKKSVRYSGSPRKEIKLFDGIEDRVIRFESEKSMNSLLSAISRYNKKEKSRSGRVISVETFRDIMLAVMMEKPPSTCSYRNLPSPEESLSSPP